MNQNFGEDTETIMKNKYRRENRRLFKKNKIEEVWIDATEIDIQRPQRKQRRYYSWKKKRHTIKATIAINNNLEICYVWKIKNWKVHDKKLLEKEKNTDKLLDTKEVYLDKWYEWIEWDNINRPKKKPRFKELPDNIKEDNRLINSIRMKVEHVIWKLKNYKMIWWKLRIRLIWDFTSVRINLKQLILNVVVWLYNLKFLF